METAQVQREARSSSVMLVEDDRDMAEAIAVVLKGAGYEIDRCYDGSEALEHLRAGTIPDVILLDLLMPNVNGWAFRVAQRLNPEWASIPVIVMTGDGSPQSAAIDADRYLQKPVLPAVLVETVERLLLARERTLLETRSVELDRIRSLGVLAAGLAHEVNNPLGFVLGNLELAQREWHDLMGQLPGSADDRATRLTHLLEQTQQGAERIASIVRGISIFARADTEQLVAMNVQDILESSVLLVASEIRNHAQLERDYASVPAVLGNPTKLGQVFINLLINAVHAIGTGDRAQHKIRVTTRVGIDSEVIISISDSGSGMPPELVQRIFDPFFSTKEIGSGMGLGLSISKGLVTGMGGSIRVESRVGAGSTFFVTLPAHLNALNAPSAAAAAPRAKVRTFPLAERATLLVIDDEPMMGEMLSNMLRSQYEVTALTSSRAALDLLETGQSFDLILCDLMMPDLTGMDLYSELACAHSEHAERLIFMTGGTFSEEARQFVDGLDMPFLTKPFRSETLRRVLAERLRELQSARSYH